MHKGFMILVSSLLLNDHYNVLILAVYLCIYIYIYFRKTPTFSDLIMSFAFPLDPKLNKTTRSQLIMRFMWMLFLLMFSALYKNEPSQEIILCLFYINITLTLRILCSCFPRVVRWFVCRVQYFIEQTRQLIFVKRLMNIFAENLKCVYHTTCSADWTRLSAD